MLEGSHFVRVVAKDAANNASPRSNTVFFTVDTVDPTITFTYPAAGRRISERPFFVRGTTDPGSSVEVQIRRRSDGQRVDPGTVPPQVVGDPGVWSYEVPATLGDDTYEVWARATDRAGNQPTNFTKLEFTLDRTPPDTSLSCPAAMFTNADTVSFTLGAVVETNVTYQCRLEKDFILTELPCPGSLSWSSPGYGDGQYRLLAWAVDAAGNVDPVPAACSWTWDKSPPVDLQIVDRPEPVTDSRLAVFRFSASDSLSTPVEFECSLDGAAFSSCTNPHYIRDVANGRHTFQVRVKDRAGNIGGTASWEWGVDTGLPVPLIVPEAGAANPTNATSATFSFQLKVQITTQVQYFYTLDDSVTDIDRFEPVTGNRLTIPLTRVGAYTIRVRARDTQRNISTPAQLEERYAWFVDRIPPAVQIESRPRPWVKERAASFVFVAPGEASVGAFLCSISNCVSSPPEPTSCRGLIEGPRSAVTLEEGIQEGRNCIQVYAQDNAGNRSSRPDTYEWNLDTQAPEPPVIEAQQRELRAATRFPAVEGSAEPNTQVELFLNNGTEPVAQATANDRGRWRAQITQEVSDGSHVLEGRTKDRADNFSVRSEPITLLVDSQLPTSVIGGGLSCSTSGTGGALLALLSLVCLGYRSSWRRRM